MKPIGFLLSRHGVHETMKQTYRHLNHRDSMSRDGVNETMKPRNHYTYGYLDVPEMECTIVKTSQSQNICFKEFTNFR